MPVTPSTDPCILADWWGITVVLAGRLILLSSRLEFGISIISGQRTCEEQKKLSESGRPTAPCGSSTHVAPCPATGADVWPAVAPVSAVRARLGAEATISGLRWGGGSPLDSDGFPIDWNHLDLGAVA